MARASKGENKEREWERERATCQRGKGQMQRDTHIWQVGQLHGNKDVLLQDMFIGQELSLNQHNIYSV